MNPVQCTHAGIKITSCTFCYALQWKELTPEQNRAYSILSATFNTSKKNTRESKRKRPQGAKDPKAPKAATSAYMFFAKHHRNLLKREIDLSFGDLGKTIGAMWKAASPEERKPFEEMAVADKERHSSQASLYKQVASDPTTEPEEATAGDEEGTLIDEVDDFDDEDHDFDFDEEEIDFDGGEDLRGGQGADVGDESPLKQHKGLSEEAAAF